MKTLYFFDLSTGELTGQGAARRSPREPDVYLIPAGATDVEPPAAQAGFARCWRNGAWAQVEDHRGQAWYRADGTPVAIHFPGPVPAQAVTQDARPAFGVWNGSAWAIDAQAQAAAAQAEQEAQRLDAEQAALKTHQVIRQLIDATPAQIDAWCETNITDLASAREAAALQWKVIAVLARRALN